MVCNCITDFHILWEYYPTIQWSLGECHGLTIANADKVNGHRFVYWLSKLRIDRQWNFIGLQTNTFINYQVNQWQIIDFFLFCSYVLHLFQEEKVSTTENQHFLDRVHLTLRNQSSSSVHKLENRKNWL
jgi:hypothetical protein